MIVFSGVVVGLVSAESRVLETETRREDAKTNVSKKKIPNLKTVVVRRDGDGA